MLCILNQILTSCLTLGEVAGVLCSVGGQGVCEELMPHITGGIEGNLERDSGEVDPHLTQKLSQTSSSTSHENSPLGERVERVCACTYIYRYCNALQCAWYRYVHNMGMCVCVCG